MEFKNHCNEFLPEDVTNAVKNADLEKINTFSIEQLNGDSNLYMGLGRPLIFDALSGFNSCEVLKCMIDKGTNVNCVDTGIPNKSLLMAAVKNSYLDQIKIIVDAGANLNFIPDWHDGDYPQSIIGTALFYKRYQIVDFLQEKGAKYLEKEEEIIKDFHSKYKY
jgi:hypothetical protein